MDANEPESAMEEVKGQRDDRSPKKSAFAFYPGEKMEKIRLINPINMKPVLDLMEIPEEYDNPLVLPYVSTMSPQNKARQLDRIVPTKKMSENVLPLFQFNAKKH